MKSTHTHVITRRGFVIGCAAAAPLALAGCGGGSPAIAGPTPQVEVLEVEKTFTIGSYDETLFGMDIRIRNNGDSAISGSIIAGIDAVAEQGGKELQTGWLSEDITDVAGDSDVNAGEEGTVELLWTLENEEDPVTVRIEPYDTEYAEKVEVLNEEYKLADTEKIVSEASFDVTIDKAEVTDDGEGGNLLLLTMTFTNNSDEPTSFSMAVEPQLFQAGIELQWGYLPYGHPASNDDLEMAGSTEIKSGASIQLMEVYELQDAESPVEVKLIDYMSYDRRAVVDTTIELS